VKARFNAPRIKRIDSRSKLYSRCTSDVKLTRRNYLNVGGDGGARSLMTVRRLRLVSEAGNAVYASYHPLRFASDNR